ncbi:MAG TPA: AAC(3) family N-acetyltransferase [Anaerolineales bacterium]|nr:AAC(3) family N-acetyltransferase [Anaerolineales bacterium]
MAPSLGYRDAVHALRELGLEPGVPVLAVGAPEWLDEVRGDISSLAGALLASSAAVLAPAFTLQTMVTPPFGPEGNGMAYRSTSEANAEAEFFRADMPAHPSLGPLPDALRHVNGAHRSIHPILSFVGVEADELLAKQSLTDPWGPIAELATRGGEAVLLGADHTANVALHLAAQRAGRKQFVRWALTAEGVVECPAFPGCSRGFAAIAPRLRGIEREAWLGSAHLQAIPLRDLLHTAAAWMRQDPAALLCDDPTCALCDAVRSTHS